MEPLDHPLREELSTLFEGEGEDVPGGLNGVSMVVKMVSQNFEGESVREVLLELAEGEHLL